MDLKKNFVKKKKKLCYNTLFFFTQYGLVFFMLKI
jgi:hypothetical protein